MSAPETLQLNCPKCNATIRASTKSVGKRVRCPRCQAAFKIPGQAPVERDDDDWLNLDALEDPPRPAPSASPKPQPLSSPARTGERGEQGPSGEKPAHSPPDEDDDGLDSFMLKPEPPASSRSDTAKPIQQAPDASSPDDDDDLDPFMLKSEELPPPSEPKSQPPGKARSGGRFSEADMQALNSILKQPPRSSGTSGRSTVNADDLANDDFIDDVLGDTDDVLDEQDVVAEFRVTCPICGSLTYARPNQVGKQVKCPDCYSMITIPPPPKVRKAYTPDIENAETFAMIDSGEPAPVYGGPMAKSAAELLREAEEGSDGDERERERDDYDNPDVKKWLSGIFGIFRDPGVILHLLVLSLLGAAPGVVAALIGHPAAILVGAGVTFLYFSFVLACAFSILESVANGEKEVSEWPFMHPGEWLGRMLMAVAAASLAAGPVALVASMLFGPSMLTVAMTMFSLYVFFPFVLLSMLDSESIFVPFSPEVSKSVTRCQEAWGVLYLSAGLLFFGLLIFYIVVSFMPPVLTAILVSFGTVAALFTYFSMIGQLAYAIGHAVNAPPKKNDIERIRAKERAERETEYGTYQE